MTRFAQLLVGFFLLLSPAVMASEDPPSEEHPVPTDASAHARAPMDVMLQITEDDLLRSPGTDAWFEQMNERFPGRFVEVDELVEVDGEMEAGWQDSQGEYVAIYDEEEDEIAYWQHVPAETLTRGRTDYVQYCASCHGFEGDGYGRSGQHLRPPPRNFSQGLYKFAKVPGGKLPTDETLVQLVQHGLDGTPMLPWALSDEQLTEIVQYIKSLSPPEVAWRDVYSEIDGKVDIGDDPFEDDSQAGVDRGRAVYHAIGCYNCHPGYVTPKELDAILVSEGKKAAGSYRDGLTYSRVDSPSSYTVQGDYQVMILPPDFTFHTMRVGRTPGDVAETVAAGIPGANMPTWKGSIPDRDIWAIGYYVRHLIDEYKDQPGQRAAFMAGLRQGN